MDINSLRKSRGIDFSKITGALSKSTEGGYKNDDDEYFKLVKDKAGNASAVIRFLPTAEGDDLPWVQIYSHAFKGPTGKWYIENCLSTIGQEDPINESNRALWQGGDKDKDLAKQRKRKLTYTSNVYVVSDPSNRENEGKVLKFKYGKKIFEKITQKLEPAFEDDKPVNVFDLWEGCNFKLRMRQYEGYPNYDLSAFSDATQVAETDEEILEIVNKQYKLRDLIAVDKFKTYDELKKKMDSVLNSVLPAAVQRIMEDTPVVEQRSVGKTVASKDEMSDDDNMDAFFKSIEV